MSPLRVFRAATVADVPLVARLVNLAYEVEAFFVVGPRTSEAEVRGLLASGRFLVLEEDRAPIGCVYLEVRGQRGYLGMLAVEPARQGGGRGRALVEAVERTCAAEGLTHVDLHVVDLREELHGFYRRLGYVAVGARPFVATVGTTRPCHLVTYEKTLAPAAAP